MPPESPRLTWMVTEQDGRREKKGAGGCIESGPGQAWYWPARAALLQVPTTASNPCNRGQPFLRRHPHVRLTLAGREKRFDQKRPWFSCPVCRSPARCSPACRGAGFLGGRQPTALACLPSSIAGVDGGCVGTWMHQKRGR